MNMTRKTIQSYNRCANTFVQEHMDLGVFKRFIQEFSDLLKVGASILDLGCGPGNIGKFLMNQKKRYKLLGVDLSPEMLRLAKQHVPDGKFILADLRDLRLQEKFDAVIVSFCIIHLDTDHAKDLLRKAFDLLNAGGYLYLSFMSGGKPGLEKATFSQDELYFNYFMPKQIPEYLERLGYRIISKYRHDYQKANNQVIQDIILIAQK